MNLPQKANTEKMFDNGEVGTYALVKTRFA